MIKRLKRRFFRIATLSVTIVMLLLTLILNAANFIFTDSDLTRKLDMICENRGTIPQETHDPVPPILPKRSSDKIPEPSAQSDADFSQRKPSPFGGPFNPETPFSTRYFTLILDESGNLQKSDLSHIAAVTDDETAFFAEIAARHGEGYGYCSGYKFRVIRQDDGHSLAVFLDCYQEIRALKSVLLWSALADIICIFLVALLVLLFSGRAIEPVVQSTRRQKQFITDASHELKTPVTVIATSLKVLEMETGPQKWIDKAMAQTEKLKELINALVTLSRMDEENSPLCPAPFNADTAAREAAEAFSELAEVKGCTLQCSIQPDIIYNGDEQAVRQLCSILLDNAVKYALPDTTISFSLKGTKKGILIRTANACEPISTEHLDKLFDRFYRADPSHNSKTGGFGIGLSIAQAIAEGHRGSIHAESKNSTSVEFIAELK